MSGARDGPRDAPESTFEDFYRSAFPVVSRSLYLLAESREDAFDMTQEAFARTWNRWDAFEAEDRPLLYTLRVAANLAKTALRRKRLWRRAAPRLAEVNHDGSTDSVLDRLEVHSALRSLSFKQRAAVVLVDVADVKPDEAAALLGVNPSTLRVHLARARERLRRELGPKNEPEDAPTAVDRGRRA